MSREKTKSAQISFRGLGGIEAIRGAAIGPMLDKRVETGRARGGVGTRT